MLIAYKGFESDLTCRGFQYELGKSYFDPQPAKICEHGFHACVMPADVFDYYPRKENNVYAKVLLDREDMYISLFGLYSTYLILNSKVCAQSIHIFPKLLTVEEMMQEQYEMSLALSKFIFPKIDSTNFLNGFRTEYGHIPQHVYKVIWQKFINQIYTHEMPLVETIERAQKQAGILRDDDIFRF